MSSRCTIHVNVHKLFTVHLGFPIAIPLRATALELRAIARNCAQLCDIMRNCAQFLGVYRARNCAQVKSTCVGNPRSNSLSLKYQRFTCMHQIEKM